MERFIWKTIVRFKSLHFQSFSESTFGQLTWIFLNNLIDYDEQREKIHPQCLEEWDKQTCLVCHKSIEGLLKLREINEKFEDKIYRPGEDDNIHYHGISNDGPTDLRKELTQFLEEHKSNKNNPTES